MYKIIKDEKETVQDSLANAVIDPELKEKINSVSSLTYSIPYNNELYDSYQEMKTVVSVYGENENNPEFKGRLLNITKSFDGNKKLKFEGELAYLNDVLFPPYSFSGSPEEFFENVLNYYNSHCSEDKYINKGIVTVKDANDYITRENQDYSSCWNVISEKLVNMLGGYIKLRYVNNERYLDYLLESGNKSNQTIEFGKNLLDLEDYIDATSLGTVIIPLGAKDENGERVTIESVNEGKNYIESPLSQEYGKIEKKVQWDDVTLPSNLKRKAIEYSEKMILADKKITVKAIDLHFTDEQIDSFKIGNIIPCISKPHNLNIDMTLVERTRKLNDPSNDTISLGTEYKSLSGTVSEVVKLEKENDAKLTGNWLQNIIEENTKTLLGGSGGYVYIHYADDQKKHPDAIYIMDSENAGEAKNVILMNRNGIGYSNNGIQGPFVSAWTIDGKFNTDTIQAHTITANHLESNIGEKLDLSSNESITMIVGEYEKMIVDIQGITNTVKSTSGENIIRDSIGCFNDGSWTGDFNIDSSNETRSRNMYGYALLLKKGTLEQINRVTNGEYTISFTYRKLISLANIKVTVNDKTFILSNTEYTQFKYTFSVMSGFVSVTFESDTDNASPVINLTLNKGNEVLQWSLNPNETWSDNVKIGRGVRISSSGSDVEFVAYADVVGFQDKQGNYITTFDSNGLVTNEIVVKNKARIVKLLIQDINGQTIINRLNDEEV